MNAEKLIAVFKKKAIIARRPTDSIILLDDAIDLINEAMEGKVLVPVEPDEEIITRGRNAYIKPHRYSYDATAAMYTAMIGQDNELDS